MARGLKFWIWVVEGLHYLYSETKALISFGATAKLICVFVFAYAKSRFSHDAAHVLLLILHNNELCISEDNIKLICNKGIALEAKLLKNVLISIKICLFYFNICCKLFFSKHYFHLQCQSSNNQSCTPECSDYFWILAKELQQRGDSL